MTNREAEIIGLVHKEVKPALGCTEPVAVALATARAIEIMMSNVNGFSPAESSFKINVEVSGNILKNGMGVGIPGTGMIGLRVAAALGAVCGKSSYGLEVLKDLDKDSISAAKKMVAEDGVCISIAHDCPKLYVKAIIVIDNHKAWAVIENEHDKFVETGFDDKTETLAKRGESQCESADDKETRDYHLTVKEIFEFANTVDFHDIEFILDDRKLNLALAEEGLKGNYGLRVGKTILACKDEVFGDDFLSYAMALTAAASDARMAGCTLPAMSNSGSGNQGITASVPVIVYARETGKSHEELLRALCVSNLVTTHLKTGIGRLSAYCGAVSAGVGAGAGIAYLKGGRFETIAHTVVNAIAVTSGIICDGAKASCAAKIAASVDAGLLGLAMFESGNQFFGGDGIVKKGVENTIATVGKLVRIGMEQTDKEIIHLMMEA